LYFNLSEPTPSRIKQNIQSRSSPMAKKLLELLDLFFIFYLKEKSDFIYESVKNGVLFIFHP
jgi:hypothetical protein